MLDRSLSFERVVALIPIRGLEDAKARLGEVLDAEERRALVERLLARTVAAAATTSSVADVVVISPDRDVLALAGSLGARGVAQEGSGLNEGLAAGRAWATAAGADAILVVPADLPAVTAAELGRIVERARAQAGSLPVAGPPTGSSPAGSRLVGLAGGSAPVGLAAWPCPAEAAAGSRLVGLAGGSAPVELSAAARSSPAGLAAWPCPAEAAAGSGGGSLPVGLATASAAGSAAGAIVALVTDRAGSGTNVLLLAPPDAISFCFGEGSRVAHAAAARAAGAIYLEITSPLDLDLDTPDDLLAAEAAGLGGLRAELA